MTAPGLSKVEGSPEAPPISVRSFELIPEAGAEILVPGFRADIGDDGSVTLHGSGTFTLGEPAVAFRYGEAAGLAPLFSPWPTTAELCLGRVAQAESPAPAQHGRQG